MTERDQSTSGSEQPINPLEKLKQQAQEAKKRREKEVVTCPECGTEALKDSIKEAVEVAEQHDEKRHGGNRTAKVNGFLPPQFSEQKKEQIQQAVRSLRTDTDRSEQGDRR
jgi:hypothetical protein